MIYKTKLLRILVVGCGNMGASHAWSYLGDSERAKIAQEGRRWLTAYYQRLNRLQEGVGQKAHEKWFAQVGLYGSYFNYHLRRLELLSKMEAITDSNKQILETGQSLSEPLRNKLVAMNDEIYALAYGYDQQVAQVPGQMMASLRANKLTLPFKERVFDYDSSLDNVLAVKKFDSRLRVLPVKLIPGQPFELKMELQNVGCMPWISGVGLNIVLDDDTARFGLPARWDYDGEPMVFGDRRIITLRGVAPEQHGTAKIKINFISPGRSISAFLSQTVELKEP